LAKKKEKEKKEKINKSGYHPLIPVHKLSI
jgi:hypothetical protein